MCRDMRRADTVWTKRPTTAELTHQSARDYVTAFFARYGEEVTIEGTTASTQQGEPIIEVHVRSLFGLRETFTVWRMEHGELYSGF